MSYIKVTMPIIDVNEEEATVTDILCKEEEKVDIGDLLFVVENTKATNNIVSEKEGYILNLCDSFDTKKNGDSLALIFDSIEELRAYRESKSKDETSIRVNATKKAIALAESMGIDIREIAEACGDTLIKEKDVSEFANKSRKVFSSKQNHDFILRRERVVIIGAGKGAEVVIDILLDDPSKEIVGLVDDNVKEFKNYNFPILNCGIKDFPQKYSEEYYDTVIISIGSNLKSMKLRQQIYEEYDNAGVKFTNAIAKSAEIRRGVQIGVGNIIGAGCYIGTLTCIGNNNTISYGAKIGHHNIIGSHNLIAPNVCTSGSDSIGNSCIIPAGISVINRASIGDEVILPVGYAVNVSIESGRVIKMQNNLDAE